MSGGGDSCQCLCFPPPCVASIGQCCQFVLLPLHEGRFGFLKSNVALVAGSLVRLPCFGGTWTFCRRKQSMLLSGELVQRGIHPDFVFRANCDYFRRNVSVQHFQENALPSRPCRINVKSALDCLEQRRGGECLSPCKPGQSACSKSGKIRERGLFVVCGTVGKLKWTVTQQWSEMGSLVSVLKTRSGRVVKKRSITQSVTKLRRKKNVLVDRCIVSLWTGKGVRSTTFCLNLGWTSCPRFGVWSSDHRVRWRVEILVLPGQLSALTDVRKKLWWLWWWAGAGEEKHFFVLCCNTVK